MKFLLALLFLVVSPKLVPRGGNVVTHVVSLRCGGW